MTTPDPTEDRFEWGMYDDSGKYVYKHIGADDDPVTWAITACQKWCKANDPAQFERALSKLGVPELHELLWWAFIQNVEAVSFHCRSDWVKWSERDGKDAR